MPANRVASLATFITGLAGCATALAGFWPNGGTTQVALIAGSVASIAGPLSHVVGSWLWDRTPAGQAAGQAVAAVSDTPDPQVWVQNRTPEPEPAATELVKQIGKLAATESAPAPEPEPAPSAPTPLTPVPPPVQ